MTASLSLAITNVPAELRQREQWLTWQYEDLDRRQPDGTPKLEKVPKDITFGHTASVTNPASSGRCAQAVAACNQHNHSGVGFVFTADDPYYFGDLDHCFDDDGFTLQPWARLIVDRLRGLAYIERSPSRQGLHIIGHGVPPQWRKKKGQLEIYFADRFATITGNVFEGCNQIGGDSTDLITAIHREHFGDPPQERKTAPRTNEPPADDLDVIERMVRGRNGAKRAALIAGDTSAYPSPSEAEAAAIEAYLFETGGDADGCDQFMRGSTSLWREKWDTKRGEKTYLRYSIDNILGRMTSFRDPNYGRPAMPQVAVDLQPLQASSNGAGVNGHDAASHQASDDLVCRPAAEWAALEAENERLQARVIELEGLAATTSSIRRNKHLGSAKATAEALPHQLASLQEHAKPDNDGLYRVTLARIAEAAGVSESSAGKHLRDLESKGLLIRKLHTVAKQRDGERPTVERELHIGMPADCTNVVDFAQRLAAANLEKNHGGKRERTCPHCSADLDTQATKTTTTVECLSCNQVAEGDVVTRWTDRTGKRRISRSALADDLPVVNEHDAVSEDAAWEIVKVQLAPTKNVSTTEGGMPFLNKQDALSQNGQPAEPSQRPLIETESPPGLPGRSLPTAAYWTAEVG